jgi:hypothetical protein
MGYCEAKVSDRIKIKIKDKKKKKKFTAGPSSNAGGGNAAPQTEQARPPY